MSSNSVRRGAKGGSVTIFFQLLKILVQLLSVIILSRILGPDEFGVIAMATVVVALGDLLRDLGLSVTGLQATELSEQQSSNLLWASALLGLVAAFLIWLSSPLLVFIYDEPRLYTLIPVLSVGVILNGFQSQYRVRLARSFRYTALNASEFFSHFIAFLAATVAALSGWGYWSLALQAIVMPLSLLVMNFISTRWIPLMPTRDGKTLPLLRMGLHHSGTALLNYGAANMDTLLIGAHFGTASLGLYNRAYQLLTVPVQRLVGSLTPVAVTTINSAKNAGESIYKPILRLQSLLASGTTFMFCIAVSIADPVIPMLLGDEWGTTTIIFQLLACGGAALSLSQVSYWLFLTESNSRELLKYNLVTKPLVIVLLIIGAFISLHAVAIAYSVGLVTSWVINVIWLGKVAEVPSRRLLHNGTRVLLTGAIVSGVVLIMPTWLSISNDMSLIAIKFGCAFVLFIVFLASTRSGRDDIRYVLSKLSNIVK